MIARVEGAASPLLLEARRQLAETGRPLGAWAAGDFRFEAHYCDSNLWVAIRASDGQPLALRAMRAPNGPLTINHVENREQYHRVEAISDVGALRADVTTVSRGDLVVLRCTTRLIPNHHLRMSQQPRDLFVLATQGESPQTSGRLYTVQHGFQTGSLFGASAGRRGSSFFYFQNFSSLKSYFEDTKTTPRESVGGTWPEMGFSLPLNEECPLLASNEYAISDVYLVLRTKAPASEGEAALQYLDALAEVVALLDAPPRTYHNWFQRAAATVYDLSQSPECSMVVEGSRYLAAYVNAKDKPPESMVQLTVLAALAEFEKWTGGEFTLTTDLLDGIAGFVDEEIGSVVRWLPGRRFGSREDEHQTHRAMDSWYLYHVLFNLSRLAAAGNEKARKIITLSLPYAIRVAKRFAYRWPIFFDLATLEILEAEAQKGSGGENDVSGLYALVMIHAYELFGDETYLAEAERAAKEMEGFGFGLSYQTNTTGFSAEATLRLWKLTGNRRYFDLTMVALANIFDNMSIWESGYGNAKWYSTFFGLYPLRGAPYIAAYEETEALAKFHEFLRLGGDDLPKSVTLLIPEYAKWLVSRGWQYYPGELPQEMLSQKVRNGTVRRELAIPLEDLQDGLEPSGQVGQEIYGAGLALVCATRHYRRIARRPFLLFCEYPTEEIGRSRWRVAGDPRMTCEARLIPANPNAVVPDNALGVVGGKRRKSYRSVEGHTVLEVRGGDVLTVLSTRKS